MPKNIEDVIVPEKRRSIRDIPIPENRRRREAAAAPFVPREYSFPEGGKAFRSSKKRLWIAIGTAALILIFAVLFFFDGATLSYVPRSAALSFDNDVYRASKAENGLTYSVVKLSKEISRDVPASGTEEVNRKSSGRIVVYNKTSQSQKLRATTRFETPEGKIYQVENAITVPPGSLEVLVYAEKPGSEYNIGLSDFTLPGLKGTSLFSSVYARSRTLMTGGFVGRESIIKSEDKLKAESEIQESLRNELFSEAKAQVPAGFIILPSLSSVTFESLPASASSGDNATVTLRGDFAGAMFKESELSTHLAGSKIDLSPGEAVDIVSLESLRISFATEAPRDLVSSGEITFAVSGQAMALWHTDEVALKRDLAGKHKRDISSIFNNYPTIVSATATVKPFWRKAFPSDSLKITIIKLPVN